jgi:transposase-like protein
MVRELKECPKCGLQNVNIVKIGTVTTVKWGKRTRWKSQDCGHTFYLENKEEDK